MFNAKDKRFILMKRNKIFTHLKAKNETEVSFSDANYSNYSLQFSHIFTLSDFLSVKKEITNGKGNP